MATQVTSKTELQTISGDLSKKIETLKSDYDSMKSVLDGASDYDGINVTGPAKILKGNLDIIIKDMQAVSTNITNYANAIAEFDMDDFTESIFSKDIVKDNDETGKVETVTLSTDTNNNSGDSNNSSTNTNLSLLIFACINLLYTSYLNLPITNILSIVLSFNNSKSTSYNQLKSLYSYLLDTLSKPKIIVFVFFSFFI